MVAVTDTPVAPTNRQVRLKCEDGRRDIPDAAREPRPDVESRLARHMRRRWNPCFTAGSREEVGGVAPIGAALRA